MFSSPVFNNFVIFVDVLQQGKKSFLFVLFKTIFFFFSAMLTCYQLYTLLSLHACIISNVCLCTQLYTLRLTLHGKSIYSYRCSDSSDNSVCYVHIWHIYTKFLTFCLHFMVLFGSPNISELQQNARNNCNEFDVFSSLLKRLEKLMMIT